ncbi:amidoligase enzyme [Mycobacteroides abscessus]|uniref:amidoligase enzyme n=1 Tax=Mycobacteroides abscessus TaxID=36809 RepID=UPI0010C9D42F|nr:amidoligase enzyme [Mycobacteroides abscessus]
MPSATITFYSCEECGFDVDSGTGYYCESCDHWNCDDCGSCRAHDDDARIHVWNYRPRNFRPKGNFPSEPLLGVELEVCGRESAIVSAVDRIDDSEDHLYLKEDGSIHGVEIVTHPMTLAWARKFPFARLLEDMKRSGCAVDDGYGLHIHVSRNAFQRDGKQSASHQMLWLLFMYRNVSELEKLARRTSTRWAAFKKPDPGELARKAQAVACDDRYVAVNCNNKNTFELRFFKSTLEEREFYAALEFADASVRYTRGLAIQDVVRGKAIGWRHFTTWARRHNYRNLLAEIGE